ncbi:MAG: MarR family transcriptional regulator [Pseudonocardiales bacterium]|nr:MAG: MarR family transcriptional regulator [Pseudonocardiales bacterium]
MPAATRTDSELASVLRMSVMRLARRLRAHRLDSGLSLTQLAALATLERHGAMSPGDLAEHEKVQPPSITRVLALLESRGLTTRAQHPTDGRQQIVTLTKQGKALLSEDRRKRTAWLARQLTLLSAEERALLRAAAPVLERLGQL